MLYKEGNSTDHKSIYTLYSGKCEVRPCNAISSDNWSQQPRFNLTEHPTSHRGEGWVKTDTCVVSCQQFETHVLSVSSWGTTYTVHGVNSSVQTAIQNLFIF